MARAPRAPSAIGHPSAGKTASGASAVDTAAVPQGRVGDPLVVGVLDFSSNTAAVAAIGGKTVTSVSADTAVQELVKYYNARGGISGRPLRLVEYTENSGDASYDADEEAACARFTQDNRVPVVISMGQQWSDSYLTCLAKAGVVDIETHSQTGADRQGYATYPGMVSVAGIMVNRRVSAVLTGLAGRGFLTPKHRIGALVEDCPFNERAYATTFLPAAKRLGLTVIRRDVDCLTGFSGVADFESQVAAAVTPVSAAPASIESLSSADTSRWRCWRSAMLRTPSSTPPGTR